MIISKPLISVIIPVYNVSLYVEQCLKSVLNQTYENLDVILVDDCGTDNSVDIIKRIIERYNGSKNIRLLHHDKNRGQSVARNTGVAAADGDFISFIDSDDFIADEFYEILYNELKTGDYGIITSNPRKGTEHTGFRAMLNVGWDIDKDFIISPDKFAEYFLLQKTCNAVWGKIFRKELIQTVRFKEGNINEDILFFCDLSKEIENKGIKTKVISYSGYFYRENDVSVCRKERVRPYYFYELENLQLMINEMKNRKNLLSQELEKRYIKIVVDKMKSLLYYKYPFEKYSLNNYLELSSFLRFSVDNQVYNSVPDLKPRDYYCFKYLPKLYAKWYSVYILHKLPTLSECFIISLGKLKRKLTMFDI